MLNSSQSLKGVENQGVVIFSIFINIQDTPHEKLEDLTTHSLTKVNYQ